MRSIRGAVTAPRQPRAHGNQRAPRRLRGLRARRRRGAAGPALGARRAAPAPPRPARSSRPPPARSPRGWHGAPAARPRRGACACAHVQVRVAARVGVRAAVCSECGCEGKSRASPVTPAAPAAPGNGGRPGGCSFGLRSHSRCVRSGAQLAPSWPRGRWGSRCSRPRPPRALTFADLALLDVPEEVGDSLDGLAGEASEKNRVVPAEHLAALLCLPTRPC